MSPGRDGTQKEMFKKVCAQYWAMEQSGSKGFRIMISDGVSGSLPEWPLKGNQSGALIATVRDPPEFLPDTDSCLLGDAGQLWSSDSQSSSANNPRSSPPVVMELTACSMTTCQHSDTCLSANDPAAIIYAKFCSL